MTHPKSVRSPEPLGSNILELLAHYRATTTPEQRTRHAAQDEAHVTNLEPYEYEELD